GGSASQRTGIGTVARREDDLQPLGRRRLLGAAVMAATGFATATLAQTPQDTLKVALAARSPRTLDPIKSVQGADSWTHVHVFDTLVAPPPGRFASKPQDFLPVLAEQWQGSDDSMRWTFKLREGVQFHKGYGELTADDVKFTYDRLVDPAQSGGF